MFMNQHASNRCEASIEVIMKMGVQWGGCFFFLGGGVRVDENEELKFLCKCKKKKIRGGGGPGLGGGGGGLVGLGGQGGCERKSEVIVTIQK